MKEILKNTIRRLLLTFHMDLTKNLKYDRLTRIILKQYLKKDYNCVDVGCHKGEILDLMFKYAPNGRHYAFEPIPYLYSDLQNKYQEKANIYPFALSDTDGETRFQLVKNAPAYSGIRRRRYDIKNPEIEEISVVQKKLDEIIPADEKIQFIKIDVEGGEFDVLRGARNLLKVNKPIVLFECGKGASDYYGTTPAELYSFFVNETELKIFTLQSFIGQKKPLSTGEFENLFDTNKEYYFVAAHSTED